MVVITMRITLYLLFIAALVFQPAPQAQADVTLGGLACNSDLSTVLGTLKVPNYILARRADDPSGDYAVLRYEKQGVTAAGLTSDGSKMEFLLTESPTMATNDGIKVGDSKSTVISKQGQPEETGHQMQGITEYWYWTKGINFGIDDQKNTVANIYIFPPRTPDSSAAPSTPQADTSTDRISLTTKQMDIQHQYAEAGGEAYITGELHNKAAGALSGVRLGLKLVDKNGNTVKTISVDTGSIQGNESIPFKVSVPPKGAWASYTIGVQAMSGSPANSKPRIIRIKAALKASKAP